MEIKNPQDATMFALGKFVKRMNDLESAIQDLIAVLIDPDIDTSYLNIPTVASIVSAELNYSGKLRVVDGLLALRWPETVARLAPPSSSGSLLLAPQSFSVRV